MNLQICKDTCIPRIYCFRKDAPIYLRSMRKEDEEGEIVASLCYIGKASIYLLK